MNFRTDNLTEVKVPPTTETKITTSQNINTIDIRTPIEKRVQHYQKEFGDQYEIRYARLADQTYVFFNYQGEKLFSSLNKLN